MSVGQELLEVPLPSMVHKLSQGIADGQRALDEGSVQTAKELAETEIDVVPQITRTINQDGSVDYQSAEPITMSLLEVGLNPTFYQFSEATIDVTMDISQKVATQTSVEVSASASVDYMMYSASINVDAKHARQTSKEVNGTSHLKTVMEPKSPPPRLMPEVETVDNRQSEGGGGGGE